MTEHGHNEHSGANDGYASFNTETPYAELNMANYDDNDVAQLNAWGIEAAALIERMKITIRVAYRCGYHAGHADTVDGHFRWCMQGSMEKADEWFEDEFGVSNE